MSDGDWVRVRDGAVDDIAMCLCAAENADAPVPLEHIVAEYAREIMNAVRKRTDCPEHWKVKK